MKISRVIVAIIFAGIGILWTLDNYGVLPFSLEIGKLWPLVFVFIAISMLFDDDNDADDNKCNKKQKSTQQ